MGQTRVSVDDSGADSNVDHDSPAQEVPEEKVISQWPRDPCSDILAKNVAAFCSSQKKIFFPEAKLRSSELAQAKQGKRQSTHFEEKRSTRKYSLCSWRQKLKEVPEAAENKGSGDLR